MSYPAYSCCFPASPFDLTASDSYGRWRDTKLESYPLTAEAMLVELRTAGQPTPAEQAEIRRLCRKTNMAIYAASPLPDKNELRSFASIFGLKSLDSNMLADGDGISSITAAIDPRARSDMRQGYIPYTTRPMAWHTDGYYNPPHRLIRGMILYCVTPALAGGVSAVLDPEILYIRLRDESPDRIAALSRPDSITIPANTDDARPDQSGAVFSYDARDGSLYMRYTHRIHSVVWHKEAIAAATRLRAILDTEDVPYIFRYRLESGQGLICNNVLHMRTPFCDDSHQQRLLYRARFLERIAGTGLRIL